MMKLLVALIHFQKKNRGGLNKMQSLILQSLSDIIQLIRFQIVLD